jgi:hypothetical protein
MTNRSGYWGMKFRALQKFQNQVIQSVFIAAAIF